MLAQNHDQEHNAAAIDHSLEASRLRSDRVILHLRISRLEVDEDGSRQQVGLQ
jgi:hypothetical protein